MIKKNILMIALLLLAVTLAGCSIGTAASTKKHSSKGPENLSRIEVYSAKDNVLINTIEDSKMLLQFNELYKGVSDFAGRTDSDLEAKKNLGDSIPLYRIVTYKSSAALYNDGKSEKLTTITIYKGTNITKMEVSPKAIKSFSVPSEYLTFYETISDTKMKFLMSLAKNN